MRKKGFTLLELLLAVAIVAVLTVILMVSAGGLRRQAQTQFTESTLAVIMTAIQQYHEFWGDYPPQVDDITTTGPPDHWTKIAIEAAVGDKTIGTAFFPWPLADHRDENTFSEVLYLRLYRTPTCRKMIEKMPSGPKLANKPQKKGGRMMVFDPESLANLPDTPTAQKQYTKKDWPNVPTTVAWDNPSPAGKLSLYRFVDAWENPLRYEYRKSGENIPGSSPAANYTTTDQFPVVRSSGPDGIFDTPDDIKSGRK